MAKKQFIALARVSSREQEREGFSLDIQVDALNAEAERRKGKIVKLWRIAETASRNDERTTFKELIAFAKQHAADLDGILFYKIDRAARNLFDYVELERLESQFHVPFFSVTQPTENTPSGRMQRRMLASMASYYTEQQSVDVREGIKRRVESGLFPQKAPYGYRNVRVDKRGLIEEHPDNGPKVKSVFSLCAAEQLSLEQVQQRLYDEGVFFSDSRPRFPKTTIYAILRNRSYVGEVRYRGEWHPGTHRPLVDQATWERVQRTLSGKNYDFHDLTFAGGLIRCTHCGHVVTGERVVKKATGKAYIYYRCSVYSAPGHPRVRLSEKRLDAKLIAILDKMGVGSDEQQAWFLRQVRNRNVDERGRDQKRATETARHLSLVIQRRQELLEMRLAGEIPAKVFADKDADLRDREKRLRATASDLSRRIDGDREPSPDRFDLWQSVRAKWGIANRSEKRRILRAVSVEVGLDHSEVILTAAKPFDALGGQVASEGKTENRKKTSGSALAGAPSWITPEEISEAIRVWQCSYPEKLTEDDALEIVVSVRALIDVVLPQT